MANRFFPSKPFFAHSATLSWMESTLANTLSR